MRFDKKQNPNMNKIDSVDEDTYLKNLCTGLWMPVQKRRPDVGWGCAGTGGQRSFASLAWSAKGKVTRRERFLPEMDAIIRWQPALGLVERLARSARPPAVRVTATDAAVADIPQLPELLHGVEREVFGDQAYCKEDDREFLEPCGICYRISGYIAARHALRVLVDYSDNDRFCA